jgi:secondary thiamine-phosphate synthase enzyme
LTVTTRSIQLNTRGNSDVIDITDQVTTMLREINLTNGIITIFSPSSTSAITSIEFEDGCVSDLRRLFDEIANPARNYAHNAAWGDGNGHAHVRAALLGASFSVPFVNCHLTLGTWQQIIFVDFDVRPRRRELIIQIIGE